ncbi:MAG TPA: Ig-like domain-containing protein, partial [Tepidisphaeraceae bacterium]
AGTYVVMVTVTDKDGGVGTSAFNVVVGGDNVPPQVVAGNFLYQTAPRQVAITFSEDVGASLQAGDLTVSNLTTSTDLPANATTMTWNASTLTATWTFAAGALTNANYRATLHGSAVSDGAGNAMSQDYGLDFFWLGGDANHNRTVDFNDLVPMAQNYNSTGGGKTYADGDFNGDGNVDFNDMVILAQNYNVALAAPTPSQPVAAPVSIGSPVMPSIDAVLQSLKNPTTTPTSGPSPTPKPTPKPSPKPVKSAPPTPVARPAAPKPLPVSKAAKAVTAAPPVFSNTRIATTAKKRSDLLG